MVDSICNGPERMAGQSMPNKWLSIIIAIVNEERERERRAKSRSIEAVAINFQQIIHELTST